jgi:hypothetical protein
MCLDSVRIRCAAADVLDPAGQTTDATGEGIPGCRVHGCKRDDGRT